MNSSEKAAYKKRLHQTASEILKSRLSTIKATMQQAQSAANEEEKSSAGDKYETGRAMAHLEKEMYAKQLAETRKEMDALRHIDCTFRLEHAKAGAVVVSGGLIFFIAAGLGKIMIDAEPVYFLSPIAPLAKSLFNKKAGEAVSFNNKEIIIDDVF